MTLPFDLGAIWARALAWYQGYSERDRRIILGVLVATVASVLYLGVVTPVLDYRRGIGQEISDGQEELERATRFLAAKDTLRAEREELRKRLTHAKGRLLPGGTGTLGAAALQERANAIASEKGITLQSTQVMKEEAIDPYRKVSVRLTLSGELKPLAELISGLEYDRQLTIPFIEVSRRGAIAGGKGPRNLSVTVEVTGFVQGASKGDAAGKQEAAAEGETTAEAGAEGAAPGDAEATGQPASTTTTTVAAAAGTAPPSTSTTVPGVLPGSPAALRRRAVAPGASPGPPATAAGAVPGMPTSTTVVVPTTVPITFPTLFVPTPTLPGMAPLPEPDGADEGEAEAEALPPDAALAPPAEPDEEHVPPVPFEERYDEEAPE